MADQDLRIKVAAETGAAQDALGKLADEMAGLTKASEGAGKEQQTLAKQTALTTQQVQAAREAVERAKRAQSEAAAITQAFGKKSREAAEAMDRLKNAEEAATKATRVAEVALKDASDAVNEAAKSADKKAEPAIRRMATALQRAGKDADKTAVDLRALEARIHSMGGAAEKAGGIFGMLKKGLAFGVAAGAAAGGIGLITDGLRTAGHFAVDTAATFERLRTALETTTGSQAKANAEFERLQAFAAATPFGLEEVTEGFIKLSNRGVNANDRLLTSLGNTASAMGKSLDDAVEAVADAITGENERLKEFGIVGRLAGDQVAYTFRGVTTMVERNAEAITEYLTRLGETNFSGGMEKQSRTLAGLWSTLKDTLAQFADQLMNSGVSDTLKEIMVDLTGVTGESKELAQELGGALSEGLKMTYTMAKLLIPVIGGLASAFNYLFGGVQESVQDPMVQLIARVKNFGHEAEVAEDRLIAYALAHEGAVGPMGEMIQASLLSESAQQRLTAAIRQTQIAREDQARTEGIVAGLTERRAREEAARAADLAGRKRSGERSGMMAEYAKLKGDKSLTPAQKKRLGQLKKDLDIEDTSAEDRARRAAAKRAAADAKRGEKAEDKLGAKQHDFDTDIEDFAFKQGEKTRKARMQAEAQAFEAESLLREQRLAGLDREIDLLGERADAEALQVDAVFFAIDVESEAARARESLIDQRLAAEERLARWQTKNAKTEADREKGRTRLEKVESDKRLNVLRKSADAEAKEHAKRERAVGLVVGAVTTLGEGMVSAFEAMAAGEKGAVASMLADLLKGVAKKHAILALAEAALAVGSAASYNYPAAAAHGAAAGMHAGVAIAAGVGAVAAGAVAKSQGAGASEAPKASSGFGQSKGGSSPGGGSGGGSGGDDEGLEAQQVPVSHEQLRRGNPTTGTSERGGGGQVVIAGPIHLYGGGGMDEFADRLRKITDRQDRAGRRSRN